MSDIKDDPVGLDMAVLVSLHYLADHHKLNFFHGDIKPENLFFKGLFKSSDAGTLTFLDLSGEIPDDEPAYLIRYFTPIYASPAH